MRNFAAVLMVLGLLTLATPALAGSSDLTAGLNGVATAPLDAVFGVIEGDSSVLPSLGFADPVVTRVVGLVTGSIDGLVRGLTGGFDAATFLITDHVGGPYSPDARVDLVDIVDGLFE